MLIFGAMIGADMCGKKSDISYRRSCQCGTPILTSNLREPQITSGVF